MLTVAQKILIAEISQYLCVNDIAKKGLNAGGMDLMLPRKIECVRKGLQWRYDRTPNDTTLVETSNYLLSLCAMYYLPASIIAGTATGGGSLTPTGLTKPFPLEFIIGIGAYMVDGQNALNIPTFKGYNLSFSRGGIDQSTVSSEPSYFIWNRDSGDFYCVGAALDGELFVIKPI